MLVAGLLVVPASASAEDALGPLDSSTTIEETVAAETAPAVSIASDLADYAPGDTVTLTGTGWAPGEAVHLEIAEVDGEGWTHTADVAADGDGVLVYSFSLPDRYVPTYNVTATGATSGTATTSFTDSIGGGAARPATARRLPVRRGLPRSRSLDRRIARPVISCWRR